MLTQPHRPAVSPLVPIPAGLVLAAILGLTAWLAAAAPVRAAEVTVDIASFSFQPGTVTVQVGDTVTWTNNDATAHTATNTDDPALFDGEMAPGESFSFTFTEAGSFDYICELHPAMQGTVVVEAAASSPGASGLPDGAMASHYDGGLPPPAMIGVALIALSLLAGSGVARRQGRTTR
jgi:plastocyanin